MAVTLSVGHKLNMNVLFLDQHGNPMLADQTVDAAPTWSNTTPDTETLAPSASGLNCIATPIAAGNDTVSLSVAVGGHTFAATLDVTVTPEEQVLTSIAIGSSIS